jgi:hypothetical protein
MTRRAVFVPLMAALASCAKKPETVRDQASGLVIQVGFSPQRQNQAAAFAYCATLPLAGGGWRLPTRDELSVALANRTLLADSDDWFWSAAPTVTPPSRGVVVRVAHEVFDSAATRRAAASSRGWIVHFTHGFAYADGPEAPFRARCVR